MAKILWLNKKEWKCIKQLSKKIQVFYSSMWINKQANIFFLTVIAKGVYLDDANEKYQNRNRNLPSPTLGPSTSLQDIGGTCGSKAVCEPSWMNLKINLFHWFFFLIFMTAILKHLL